MPPIASAKLSRPRIFTKEGRPKYVIEKEGLWTQQAMVLGHILRHTKCHPVKGGVKWWEGDVCVVWLDPMQKLRVPERAGPESLPQALALRPLLCELPAVGYTACGVGGGVRLAAVRGAGVGGGLRSIFDSAPV